jgi:hypothetical protein
LETGSIPRPRGPPPQGAVVGDGLHPTAPLEGPLMVVDESRHLYVEKGDERR